MRSVLSSGQGRLQKGKREGGMLRDWRPKGDKDNDDPIRANADSRKRVGEGNRVQILCFSYQGGPRGQKGRDQNVNRGGTRLNKQARRVQVERAEEGGQGSEEETNLHPRAGTSPPAGLHSSYGDGWRTCLEVDVDRLPGRRSG